MMPKTTFYKVTNQEIYKEILELKRLVKETNGKVKLNRWIATTALSMSFLMVGYCMAIL